MKSPCGTITSANLYDTVITQKAQEERATTAKVPDISGLSLNTAPKQQAPARPPRPAAPARKPSSISSEEEEEEDDDDPFGDKNVISTPAAERAEPGW
jgi:hypothetical protein